MVKLIILKDALSCWNFSNLWSIAGIKKGSGKFNRFVSPFGLEEGELRDCFPTLEWQPKRSTQQQPQIKLKTKRPRTARATATTPPTLLRFLAAWRLCANGLRCTLARPVS